MASIAKNSDHNIDTREQQRSLVKNSLNVSWRNSISQPIKKHGGVTYNRANPMVSKFTTTYSFVVGCNVFQSRVAFITHQATGGVLNFYNTGVVAHNRKIGSSS
jgi:hypothetical protein